ncbi:MAG: hypothetical protein ACW99F_02655 [Candidatus Hodarchaeales archaeon]|jgi:hypothetical protein
MSNKFDEYYDDYMAKQKAKTNKILPIDTPFSDLPSWKEVGLSLEYNNCIICKKHFNEIDIVEKCILCDRYFHYEELRKWIKISQSCPSCKNEA